MTSRQPSTLKAKALQILAQRDHTRLELRRKLLHYLQRQARARSATDEGDGSIAGDGSRLLGHAPGNAVRTDPHDGPSAPEPDIDELLDWLAAHRYLDESRFVESRVHARAGRFGLRRIEAELAHCGTSLDTAAAERLRSTEFDRAQAIWSRRFGAPPADAAERSRQARFLAGRGFSSDVIRRVLRAAEE